MREDQLDPVALGLGDIANALVRLGLNGARSGNGSEFGAIEHLSMEIKAGTERIADGLNSIADAIRDAFPPK